MKRKIGRFDHLGKAGYFYLSLETLSVDRYKPDQRIQSENKRRKEIFSQICKKYEVIKEEENRIYVSLQYFDDFCENYGSDDIFYWPRIFGDPQIEWGLSTLQKLRTVIDWYWLQRNPSFIADFEIIEEFKDVINWAFINGYENLVWDVETIDKYKDYLLFRSDTNNKGKSFKLLDSEDSNEHFYANYPSCLCSAASVKWDEEVLDRFKNYWGWTGLSDNPYIPFSKQ